MKRSSDWTTAEENLLDQLRLSKWSLARIALHMGRTVDSVRNKAHNMKRRRRGAKPYPGKRSLVLRSVNEVDLVDELVRRGWKCYPPNRRA